MRSDPLPLLPSWRTSGQESLLQRLPWPRYEWYGVGEGAACVVMREGGAIHLGAVVGVMIAHVLEVYDSSGFLVSNSLWLCSPSLACHGQSEANAARVAVLEEELATEREKVDELTSQRNSAVRKMESLQQDLKKVHVGVVRCFAGTPLCRAGVRKHMYCIPCIYGMAGPICCHAVGCRCP
jgi:hypothetical protein